MINNTPLYRITAIADRKDIPHSRELEASLERVLHILNTESPDIRPPGRDCVPGGLVFLRPLPTIIVPDLHARIGYLKALLTWSPPGRKNTVYQGLAMGELQVICVGDGSHSEARGIRRWQTALEEFYMDFSEHIAMDEEMRESLGVMMMVMELKTAFPRYFHFLKGNHENVANEYSFDNRPFCKFVCEGAMVTAWFHKFMGEETIRKYYEFEKKLPIFAVGNLFCVTHAEPRKHYKQKELIEAMHQREIIYDLTWTANGEAEENSVSRYLEEYFPGEPRARIFGGHRPVTGLFNTRAGGKYLQIHNPNLYIATYIRNMSNFTTNRDILILPTEKGKELY